MTDSQVKSYIEKIVYIVRKAGGIDYYHLFKIMFAAQQAYLRDYGMTIFPDEFHALPDGPVPTMLYDAIKTKTTAITDEFTETITRGLDDANYMLSANRDADMDYIATKEKEYIDNAIHENLSLSYEQLKKKFHTEAWRQSFMRHNKIMYSDEIAQDVSASEYAMNNIRLNQSFNRAWQL